MIHPAFVLAILTVAGVCYMLYRYRAALTGGALPPVPEDTDRGSAPQDGDAEDASCEPAEQDESRALFASPELKVEDADCDAAAPQGSGSDEDGALPQVRPADSPARDTDAPARKRRHCRTPLRFPAIHRMTRRDALLALLITAVYALVAFSNLGDTVAPQSFYRFTKDEPSLVIDLGAEYPVSRIFYYTGSFHDPSASSGGFQGYYMSLSRDGEEWADCGVLKQVHSNTFHWVDETVTPSEENPGFDLSAVRYIRLRVQYTPMELGEVCVLDAEGNVIPPDGFSTVPSAPALFDEQELKPDAPDYMNSMYFDEIYHARTAREFLLEDPVYENTHPPLGKSILSLGILLFGMTQFGWRFMGTLFGVLMVPFVYVLLRNLFGKTWLAVCGTLMASFEFMHFVQTRIATIDTYGLFFTILMYFFMYRFLAAGYDAPARSRLVPLALCGLSFGLGIASKWTAFYAAAGLVVLYVIGAVTEGIRLSREGRAKEYLKKLAAVLAVSVLFFVLAAGAIYYFSYIPFAAGNGREMSFVTVWNNQVSMWNYHSGLEATHTYQSSWWQWMLDGRPILYYRSSEYAADGSISAVRSFASFNTPLISWAGLAALISLVAALYRGTDRRIRFAGMLCAVLAAAGFAGQVVAFIASGFEQFTDRLCSFIFAGAAVAAVALPFLSRTRAETRPRDLFIVVGTLAQLLPWIPVTRCTFAYHYFPTSFFLTLALCAVFDRWDEASARAADTPPGGAAVVSGVRGKWLALSEGRRAAAVFTAAVLLLFALFYPYLSGATAPMWYYKAFIGWFPSWPI